MREKTWVTAVTTQTWDMRSTTFLRSEKPTTFREWDHGVLVQTEDEILMYIKHDHLVSIQFDVEDKDA